MTVLLLVGWAFVSCKRDDAPAVDPAKQKAAARKPGDKGRKPRAEPFSEEAFRMMDRNRDNKLGVREVSRATRGPWPAKQALEQFEQRDKDKDGALTLEEFSAIPPRPPRVGADGQPAEPPAMEGERLELFQKIFAEADKDRDGKVTREELWEALPPSRPKWMWQNFSTLDKDGDGFLNLDEFKAAGELSKQPAPAKAP